MSSDKFVKGRVYKFVIKKLSEFMPKVCYDAEFLEIYSIKNETEKRIKVRKHIIKEVISFPLDWVEKAVPYIFDPFFDNEENFYKKEEPKNSENETKKITYKQFKLQFF